MSETDFDHISKLFTVIDGCVNHSGKFAAIQNEAFTALAKANDQLRQNQLQKKEADEKALAEHQHRQAKLKAEEADKEAAEKEAQDRQAEKDRPKARSIPAQNLENQATEAEARAKATKVERERESQQAKEHEALGVTEPNPQLDLSGKPVEDSQERHQEQAVQQALNEPTEVDRRI